MNDAAATLRSLLNKPGMLVAPGCYDALSGLLVQQAGFDVAYMTGFGSSASVIGMPDTGYMSFAEMATHAGNIARALRIPLIADGDTGYGNAMNVYRTVRAYADAGVASVHIEDQVAPKKCGHTKGKAVIPLAEAAQKIRAAADARAERDIVIIARTDARAVEGFDAALERSLAYHEAGADVTFLEAPESIEEMERTVAAVPGPVLINVVEGGKTPYLGRQELERIGYKLAIYPATLLMAVAKTMRTMLHDLKTAKEFDPFDRQVSFEELKTIVGFPEYYAMEEKYAVDRP